MALLTQSPASLADITVVTVAAKLGNTLGLSLGILITAHPKNTAVVRISGPDASSTRGQPLGPGASFIFPFTDAALLYAVAESGSQTICVMPV
jgi:hypothetical protein